MQHAGLAYDQRPILHDFNWLIQGGDRIGITGQNGAGKTSLLNVLAGRQALDQGILKVGETVKIGYYTQQTEGIDQDKRVINYLSEVAETVVDKNGERISVANLLEQFLFPRFMHGTLIRKLSGGEQRRLYLLKILMQAPNVLLLDEPTNDLDISTLTVLENYLDQFPGTVITVSHDRYFLNRVADHLLIFKGNAEIVRYTGRFTDYLAAQENAAPVAVKKTSSTPAATTTAQQPKVKTKLTYAEQLEWEKIDDELEALDEQRQAIEAEMNASGDNYEKLAKLQKQLNDVTAKYDEKTARWEYLSEYVD